jgi:hypothetical protein
MYQPEGLGLSMVSMEIVVNLILPGALVPWGDSVSNRNWYQGYFLGG